MRQWATWGILLFVGAGCAGPRGVLLDTGSGRPRAYEPVARGGSVRVSEEEFEEALARLVLEVPLTLRPPEAGRLVRTSTRGFGVGADASLQMALKKDYGRWCRAYEAGDDCLSLLENGLGFSAQDRLAVALGLSLDWMHEGIAEAVKDTFSPMFFRAVVVSALVTWAVLAANPEPVFTKAAAVVSAVLVAYVGVEGFLALVEACQGLGRATERAKTFRELDEAGERFGRVVGREGARVFVLAATLVVSRGTMGSASWMATRLPTLPRFVEAAALGARQAGFRLEAVGSVSSVAVVDGHLVIALAPGAVAMTVEGSGGGVKLLPMGGPGEWVQVNESMSKSAREFQAKATGAPEGYAYRVRRGGEEVDFDGYDAKENVLLEAKGPNLAKFFDGELDPRGFFRGAEKFVLQAQSQRIAAQGIRVRWIVAEERFAAVLKKLFRNNKLGMIEVVWREP